MHNTLQTILSWVFNFVQTLYQRIFGDINWSVLVSWLPQDIQSAFGVFILVLFALAVFHFIKSILPFF